MSSKPVGHLRREAHGEDAGDRAVSAQPVSLELARKHLDPSHNLKKNRSVLTTHRYVCSLVFQGELVSIVGFDGLTVWTAWASTG